MGSGQRLSVPRGNVNDSIRNRKYQILRLRSQVHREAAEAHKNAGQAPGQRHDVAGASAKEKEMIRVVRLVILLWATCSVSGQIDPCELEAIGKWNTFADTAKRYTDLRTTGVRNKKERDRMEK
jgi:hypothetical protein